MLLGRHTLPPISLGAWVGASELILEGGDAAAELGSDLGGAHLTSSTLTLLGGSPPLRMRGLRVSAPIATNVSFSADNCSFWPSAAHATQRGLSVAGGEALLREVSFDGLPAGALLVDGGTVTVEDGVLRSNTADFGGAARVRGGVLTLERCRLDGNSASEAGGALAVSGGTVLLSNQSSLTGNTAPLGASAHVNHSIAAAGSLVYGLPAPLGHWVVGSFACTAPTESECAASGGTAPTSCGWEDNERARGLHVATVADAEGACEVDFPFECPAGGYGDTLELSAQSRPACTGACPAGRYCGAGTVLPASCPPGYFCPKGSASPLPCPAGTYLNVSGASTVEQCVDVLQGYWAPIGSSAPEPCPASGFYCPGKAADRLHGGSKPTIVPVSQIIEVVETVTLALELQMDLADYDEAEVRRELASTYEVSEDTISLGVAAGSLLLTVTLSVPSSGGGGAGDGSAEALAARIGAVPTAPLASSLGVGVSIAALPVVAISLRNVSCSIGSWCTAGREQKCEVGFYNPTAGATDKTACRSCGEHATTAGSSSTARSNCFCETAYFEPHIASSTTPANGTNADPAEVLGVARCGCRVWSARRRRRRKQRAGCKGQRRRRWAARGPARRR